MKRPVYAVYQGEPSWHQRKAGHISAGVVIFNTEDAANACAKRSKELRPHEPVFVRKETAQ